MASWKIKLQLLAYVYICLYLDQEAKKQEKLATILCAKSP